MAGTADNWVTAAVAIGPGKLYAKLAVPGANGRIILHTDGTPDSTQNPTALHLGMTEGGTEFSVKPNVTQFFADEFTTPIVSRVQQEEALISGSLLQILDFDVEAVLNPTATTSNLAGTKGITFGGSGVLTMTSVAVIFPLEGTPTIYGVFHLYNAYNDQGIAAQITSKSLGATPFAFRGQAITTRAVGDQTGRLFKQLAAGS